MYSQRKNLVLNQRIANEGIVTCFTLNWLRNVCVCEFSHLYIVMSIFSSSLVLFTLDKVAFALNYSLLFIVEDTQANCDWIGLISKYCHVVYKPSILAF